MGEIVIQESFCKGCRLCIQVCPKGIISLGNLVNQKGYHVAQADGTSCVGCGLCAISCPEGAIEIYR